MARKSRSSAGSSHESSPSASPSSSPASRGGNEDRIERPASARNDCAHRTGAKGAGPRRSASSTSSSAEIPRRSRNWANPPSSTGRIEPVTRRTSPRTAVGGASRPESHTVSRTDAVPSSHATARTSRIADHRSRSDAGSVRSEPSTVTSAGAMRATTAPWTRCSCTVPHPTASRNEPTSATSSAGIAEWRALGGATASTRSRRSRRIIPARSSAGSSPHERGAPAIEAASSAAPPSNHTHASANAPIRGCASRPAHSAAARAGVTHALTP